MILGVSPTNDNWPMVEQYTVQESKRSTILDSKKVRDLDDSRLKKVRDLDDSRFKKSKRPGQF